MATMITVAYSVSLWRNSICCHSQKLLTGESRKQGQLDQKSGAEVNMATAQQTSINWAYQQHQ